MEIKGLSYREDFFRQLSVAVHRWLAPGVPSMSAAQKMSVVCVTPLWAWNCYRSNQQFDSFNEIQELDDGRATLCF